MKKISLLWYCTCQGLKNLKRNRMFTWASIGTMTACIFLFGIFYFMISNFRYMVDNAESTVGITVFFDEGISQEQIDEIGTKIKARDEVKECTYISPEEAWEKCKESMFKGQEDLMDTFSEDNPLKDSASYEIYLNNIEKQEQFVRFAKSLDGVRQVNNAEQTAKGLTSFNKLVAYISGTIIIILVCVAIFLISTAVTTGISIRREEIRIMRLVGASDFFVKFPFIVEGMFIGLIGTIIPLGILYVLYNRIIAYILSKFDLLANLLTFLSVKHVFATLIPVSFVIGIGIGFIGSYITVRKHLRV